MVASNRPGREKYQLLYYNMGMRVSHGSQHGSVDGENLTALPPLEEEQQMKTEDF